MARCGQAACRHTGHQLKLLQCSESMCALSHSPCDFWAHFPCLAACCPRHVFLRRKHQKAIILLANESLSHGIKILGSHRHHDIQNSRFRTCLGDKHSQSKPITLASILGFVGPPWTLHPRRHGDMRCFFASIDSNCTGLERTFGPQKAYVQILFFTLFFCISLYANNMQTKYAKTCKIRCAQKELSQRKILPTLRHFISQPTIYVTMWQ